MARHTSLGHFEGANLGWWGGEMSVWWKRGEDAKLHHVYVIIWCERRPPMRLIGEGMGEVNENVLKSLFLALHAMHSSALHYMSSVLCKTLLYRTVCSLEWCRMIYLSTAIFRIGNSRYDVDTLDKTKTKRNIVIDWSLLTKQRAVCIMMNL